MAVAPSTGRQQALAKARENFLTDDPVESGAVRPAILNSWLRSRSWDVDAGNAPVPFVKDPNHEMLLVRASQPILAQLCDELDRAPVSIILTDTQGTVLERLTSDTELERQLDRVDLAPGFSYSEQFVGTNGIGSALESRAPFEVFGHEHYAEKLDMLACAGAPVSHPTTGAVLGLLDLTCWSRDAGPLLAALARTTSQRIEKNLLESTGIRELALFREYLRTCRRTTGPVLATNADVVMMNEAAHRRLSADDQTVLLGHAADAVSTARRAVMEIELPSGLEARVLVKPAWSETGPAGGVVQVRVEEFAPRSLPAGRAAATGAAAPSAALPGVAGTSRLWRGCCQEIRADRRSGDWLVVEGEPGTGKLTLLRAAQRLADPSGYIRVHDAADCADPRAWAKLVGRELAAGDGMIVLRHLDRLDADALDDLAALLDEAARSPDHPLDRPWAAATVTDLAASTPALDRVLSHFPRSMSVPPLRHHIEDLRDLVPYLLARLSRGEDLACSPEAMRLLMRCPWPGNVAQLVRTLIEVTQRRRSGMVRVQDLPPECHSSLRRVLTPLEAMERDAIVRSLRESKSKTQAASALGMSRATIYRKIREYGIELTE
ncbi:GAF domain-containing protein [Actinomadura barringtoniae]|uniref:GAF domain-containing protein n=1 Tax=Actinomadura barringtoniae TaxID=1427535 RepID=A0A939T5I4_9ACTN|nr:GAF domain-containing protein [Actinomadura barringtoniae]MBO2453786.1 GAF domain-containing protein [Actinomadura barringtoniae]